jgi:hypothetical protein
VGAGKRFYLGQASWVCAESIGELLPAEVFAGLGRPRCELAYLGNELVRRSSAYVHGDLEPFVRVRLANRLCLGNRRFFATPQWNAILLCHALDPVVGLQNSPDDPG